MQPGTFVQFKANETETVCGVITRIWDKPAKDYYVTIRTDEDKPRTFVRCASVVHPIW